MMHSEERNVYLYPALFFWFLDAFIKIRQSSYNKKIFHLTFIIGIHFSLSSDIENLWLTKQTKSHLNNICKKNCFPPVMPVCTFNYGTQTIEGMDILLNLRQKNKIILLRWWKTQWFFFCNCFLSYDFLGIFIHNQQKKNSSNAEDEHRNLQRLSQIHLGVFWRCPLIKAIIRALWQKEFMGAKK